MCRNNVGPSPVDWPVAAEVVCTGDHIDVLDSSTSEAMRRGQDGPLPDNHPATELTMKWIILRCAGINEGHHAGDRRPDLEAAGCRALALDQCDNQS
jgi:hypothetical protein